MMFARLLVGFLFCFTTMVCADQTDFFSSERLRGRMAVRHIERGGIGYNKGYTTLEGFFAPDPQVWSVMPFLDVRGHVFDNGRLAANAGVGFRKISRNTVFGCNIYYDYRNTQRVNYNQVGIGFETLGKRFDFRVNAYIPVGRQISRPYQSRVAGFLGHQLMLAQRYQFAMKGANTELGIHFGRSRLFDFYAAAGPYYFAGKIGPKVWGGKVRLLAKLTDYVTIELSNSYDNMFHNRFQGQVTLTLPFGSGTNPQNADDYHTCDTPRILYERMVQPVDRQEINVVGCSRRAVVATDPATGKPYNFVFVDNTSSSAGTYESPYPTLALAQANSVNGDIIYVFPGDGTTKGMDTGIILKPYQKFWGSGSNQFLQTAQGNFVIPAQTAAAPIMTNIAGDGITLASVNEVRGFTVSNVVGGNGVFGTNVENIAISDMTIDHSEFDQVHLEYRGALGNADLQNLALNNGGLYGVFIDAPSSSLACTINNCTIQDTANYAINASFAQPAAVYMTNNTIARNINPANFNFADTASLVVSGNTFNNNTAVNLAPISVFAQEKPLSTLITHNTITDNTCSAIHMALNNTNPAQITVRSNSMNNNGSGSIGGAFGSAIFIDPNSTTLGNCNLQLMDNAFSNNGASALFCGNGSYQDFQINAEDNTITNNGGAGLVFASGSNTFGLTATNNSIAQGGDHGITVSGSRLDSANITITNNQITGNTNFASGIALAHEGADLYLNVTDNNISDNETSGIIMYSPSAIQNVTANIQNNTINNNQNLGSNAAAGIDLEQYTNLSATILNNNLSNNTGSALFIGSGEPAPSVCLAMSGNTTDTDYVLSSGTGTFNLAPCNVDTVNVGTIIPVGTITAVQSCPNAIPCPP